MKPFQIFRAGKQIASSGAEIAFSEADLIAAVAAYDPNIHEAPITIGHPRDNLPAYGWVKSLSYSDGAIVADAQQVEPEFGEMVAAGRFKKRSASFYTPDSPSNPVPGVYYVRHVAFLGAQPPAVKGLKDVSFADDADSITVDFSDAPAWPVMRVVRNLREWLITKFDLETADMVAPEYIVEELQRAHLEREEPEDSPAGMPAFSEEVPSMTPEQIAAMQAENEALNTKVAALESNAANFSEREAAMQAREAAAARAAIEARVDALVKQGRVLPTRKAAVVAFAASLADAEAVFDFGEGDKAEKVTQREQYLRELAATPPAVDFSERAPAGAPPEHGGDVTKVAEAAAELVAKARESGKTLSFTEAVHNVMTAGA